MAVAARPGIIRSASSLDTSTIPKSPRVQKHRKASSTGGGRAWSDAEESYLLRTRQHKMPYKHIAAQLKKTELACRLHYHQITYGGRSRCSPSSQSSPNAPLRDRASQPSSASTNDPSPPPIFHADVPPPSAAGNDSGASMRRESIPDRSHPLRLQTDMNIPKPRSEVDLVRVDRLYQSHKHRFWAMIAQQYGGGISPAVLEDVWIQVVGAAATRPQRHESDSFTGKLHRLPAIFPPTPKESPQSSSTIRRANDQLSRVAITSPLTAIPYSATIGPSPISQYLSFSQGLPNPTKAETAPPPADSPSRSPQRQHSGFAISSLLTSDQEIRSPACH